MDYTSPSEKDQRMLMLGRQAPSSNTDLALPPHEIYSVECNKSISLIKARVQRHFSYETYLVDPAEDTQRRQQAMVEEAAKAEAIANFQKKVQKRASEVRRQLQMKKLQPVKEVEQRKAKVDRLKEYSRLVADRNAVKLRKNNPEATGICSELPLKSRPVLSEQSRYHAAGDVAHASSDQVTQVDNLSGSTATGPRHQAEEVECSSNRSPAHGGGTTPCSASIPAAYPSAYNDGLREAADAVADISLNTDIDDGHLSASASELEATVEVQILEPGDDAGSQSEQEQLSNVEPAAAGAHADAACEFAREAADDDAAPNGEAWQRMEEAVQAARHRLAALSTGSVHSGAGSELSSSHQQEEDSTQEQPPPTCPVWAPWHPGLPNTPAPRTIKILRASAGVCNLESDGRISHHSVP